MSIQAKRQIIAIGGGGFSKFGDYTPINFLMEKYFIEQTQVKFPRVCFIPTASGDSLKYIVDFYRTFESLNCKPSHLSLFDPPTADLEAFILDHDAIYVGGGNTKSMIALWKEWKLDVYLKKAWERGIVLGGISAGALCWFQEGITDSIPGALTPLKCLGFLSGSMCPHYDSDLGRRPSFQKTVQAGMASGVAVDDHVALHYVGDKLEKAVRVNDEGKAYKIYVKHGKVLEEKIETIKL